MSTMKADCVSQLKNSGSYRQSASAAADDAAAAIDAAVFQRRLVDDP